jgi:putative transposase
MKQLYAESGLEYMHHAPSADAFLYRLKMLDYEQAYSMMIDANNALIDAIASKGILKKRAIVAIDYTRIPYYGKYNSNVVRSEHKDGTNMFYCYATISIVEHGRRICLHALPVKPLDQKHEVLMRLIEHARKIVRIKLLLVDRAFFAIDCINTIDSMHVRYIMPAVKNSKVKDAIESDGVDSINNFQLGKKERIANTRLAICRVKRRVKGKVRSRTLVFATNLKDRKKEELLKLIPKEYRKRWGIETSYSKIKESKAMTRSTSNTVRMLYFMTAVLVYNAWQLANIIVSIATGVQLVRPIIAMPVLARNITQFIEGR